MDVCRNVKPDGGTALIQQVRCLKPTHDAVLEIHGYLGARFLVTRRNGFTPFAWSMQDSLILAPGVNT